MDTTEIDQIRRALDGAARRRSRSYRRRRRSLLASATLAVVLIIASVSAVADIGPAAWFSHAKATSVAARMDGLNEAIAKCMERHGARRSRNGREESLYDPGGKAHAACAEPIRAEREFVASRAYRTFEDDQAARGTAYRLCIATARAVTPGSGGVSDQEAAICSAKVGALRRTTR